MTHPAKSRVRSWAASRTTPCPEPPTYWCCGEPPGPRKAKPAARGLLASGITGGITTGATGRGGRLKAGDLLAEAREQLGEEAPPPSAMGTITVTSTEGLPP